jgi:two-component system, OmpR family, sensor kinase
MKRMGIRGRLLFVVVAAVATAVVALVAGFNVVLDRSLDRDSRDLVRNRANSERALLQPVKGGLSVVDAPNDAAADAYVWVFSNHQVIEQPRASAVVSGAARNLEGGGARFQDVSSADIRLYAEPVISDGRRLGTVVAGVSLAPYEQTRRVALVASLVFGAVVLALVAAAARWVLASALQPVRRMTRQAAAWSDRDLDHRFGLGEPHDELTELAATLDGLLDRLAASLRHEQRFSAELSHELRTPLARLIAESEVALRREREPVEYRQSLQTIHGNAEQLTRILDTLLAAARQETGSTRGTADAYAVAAEVVETVRQLTDERGVSVSLVQPQQPLRVGVETDFAARILQPVVENAIRYCDTAVTISITRVQSAVRYLVEDDGPGVSAHEDERIFDPAVRGRAGEDRWPAGSGLGLSLARRLARSVSGEIQTTPSEHGGSFAIDLPTG